MSANIAKARGMDFENTNSRMEQGIAIACVLIERI